MMAAVMMSALLTGSSVPVFAASGIDMSTDYPGVTVKAGDTVTFPLDFASLDGEGLFQPAHCRRNGPDTSKVITIRSQEYISAGHPIRKEVHPAAVLRPIV